MKKSYKVITIFILMVMIVGTARVSIASQVAEEWGLPETSGITSFDMYMLFSDEMMQWYSGSKINYIPITNDDDPTWIGVALFDSTDTTDTLFHSVIWMEEAEELPAISEYTPQAGFWRFHDDWFLNINAIGQALSEQSGIQIMDMQTYYDLVCFGGGAFKVIEEHYVSGNMGSITLYSPDNQGGSEGTEWELFPVQILDEMGMPYQNETYLYFRTVSRNQNEKDTIMNWLVADQSMVGRLYNQMKESIDTYGNFHISM